MMKIKFSFLLLFIAGIFLSLTLSQCAQKSDLATKMPIPTSTAAPTQKSAQLPPLASNTKTPAAAVASQPSANQSQVYSQASQTSASPSGSIPLGVNLSPVNDWSTQWMFIDLMKNAREWMTFNDPPLASSSSNNTVRDPWDTKVLSFMPADANGYPLSIPFSISQADRQKVQSDFDLEYNKAISQGRKVPKSIIGSTHKVKTFIGNSSHPSGRYHVMYEGVGDLSFSAGGTGNAPLAMAKKVKEGLYYLDLAEGHGNILMTIDRSLKSKPITNIKVVHEKLLEQFNKGESFHPLFVERLKDLKVAVIRLLDYQQINNSPVTSLADGYVGKNYYTQASKKGGSVVYAAELANKINGDLWVHVPAKASDEYVNKLATEIKASLNKNYKVYLEYSNELWNFLFEQASYKNQMGCADPITRINLSNNPTSCDENQSGMRFHAKRAAEVFKLFEDQLGGDRLVKVVGGQSSIPWLNSQLLNVFKDSQLNPNNVKPTALAIAPYFGTLANTKIMESADINAISVEDILNWTYGEVTLDPETLNRLMNTKNFNEYQREIVNLYDTNKDKRIDNKDDVSVRKPIYTALGNKKVTDDLGIELITYEGGQHLLGLGKNINNDQLTEKIIKANQDKKMGEIYQNYLNGWYTINPSALFMHFNNVGLSSKFGSWGLLEYQNQDIKEAPKFVAIKKYAVCLVAKQGGNCAD